jgi:hypothetical protein
MIEATGLPEGTADGPLMQAYLQGLRPDELQLQRTDFLAQGADPYGKGDFQGCSSFNPLLITSQQEEAEFKEAEKNKNQAGLEKRNSVNAPNRRVVVLLFRVGSKVDAAKWPCPRATEGTGGCIKRFWSDGTKRRSDRLPDKERRFEDTGDTFACRFYHRLTSESPCEKVLRLAGSHISVLLRSNSGAVPLANLKYSVALEDGRALEGTTDKDGLIQHDDVPPGDYELTLDGKKADVLLPTLPRYIERRTTRVPNHFLFDEQGGGNLPVIDPNEDLRAGGGEREQTITV